MGIIIYIIIILRDTVVHTNSFQDLWNWGAYSMRFMWLLIWETCYVFRCHGQRRQLASRVTKGDVLKSMCWCVIISFLKKAILVAPDWVEAEFYLFSNNGYWFFEARKTTSWVNKARFCQHGMKSRSMEQME